MRGLSTKPEYIISVLSLYKEITVKRIDNINGTGIASFFSPKAGLEEEHKPFIAIYNADSSKIYQICEEYDHTATECIMKLIRERYIVPEGEEPLYYIIFVLLHEAGHWYDYHNRHDWYKQNFSNQACETDEEYRNKPCEKSADTFALEHFESAWNELNDRLFHGMLEPLERTS